MDGDCWSETTLGAIAVGDNGLVDGPFGSNLPASAYTADGVPVIRGSNLSLGESRFNDREFVYVSAETAARLRRSICRPGDIVFTKKGTIGQTGFVPLRGRFDRYLLSSNQMKLSVDPQKADALFVYYVVSSAEGRERIVRDASITGVPKTNVAYLRDFPIRLPPLRNQRAIAHILGTLDDKIELNREMNETLEAMARALFKSWFIDFDAVRAKAEGRDPGLPKHPADLFPYWLADSELGEIPAGWRVGCVDDEFDLTMGQSPPGDTYNEAGEGVPFYQGRADFGLRFPTRRVYCTAATRFAKAGDTLISVRAPVGDINMASEPCAIGRGVAAARHKTGSRSYSYQVMRSL
jgi:type I restriction enzyme, S subunit